MSSAIDEFRARLHGQLIEPGDDGYAEACKIYNAMIDKRPRLIARCVNTADVIYAVAFGREQKLDIAVRGGGHNGAGLGTCDDGLVVDLSPMKGIRVDAENAIVSVEPGCTQADLDHATHAFGLAVPAGIVSTTGVAGLTLGGGHGYLTRQYGLTIDNLLSADVVLADGTFVHASDEQHADLFWALRGGGGNFGIVTNFVFRAHPVDSVFGGPIFWALEDGREIMRWYREFLPQAPRKVGSFLGLKTVPSTEPFPEALWGRRICALVSCYDGPEEDGRTFFETAIASLPEPLMNGMQQMPFPALQGAFDALFPAGMQWYWKGDFVKELSDAAIDEHLRQAERSPTELSLMHLYPVDGAAQAPTADASAWHHRDATWSMVIAAIDPDPANAEALKAWGREYWAALHPHNMASGYVNFMMNDEDDDRVRLTYGGNYERLVAVKRKYDPHNLFHVNQNIAPD